MITTQDVQELLANGGTVTEQDGSKIGDIGQVFLDDQTSEPEWVTVKTGMFGGAESFIPLADATTSGSEIRVPFDKSKVKDAPRVEDSEGHLSPDEETELYRYYGMTYDDSSSADGVADAGTTSWADNGQDDHTTQGTVGRDTSGPTTDDAMTRSEEQVHIGTEKVSSGKVRLRKYVVTENVTKTVPVSREEVRVEREPITDANRGDAVSGGDLTSEEHEVELTEERVVVDKDVVPVERVKLNKDTVTEEQQVSEEVRKEQIETDADTTH